MTRFTTLFGGIVIALGLSSCSVGTDSTNQKVACYDTGSGVKCVQQSLLPAGASVVCEDDDGSDDTDDDATDDGGAYGPFAIGLSAHSDTLTEFAGGDGAIGIHGTNDPASIGNPVSHGCVRVPNDVAVQLAQMLAPGTPVTIH